MKSRVSSRGQITIPVKVQRELGLRPGTPVEFEFRSGGVILRKAAPTHDPVDEVYGILKHKGLPSSDEFIEELRGPRPGQKHKHHAHGA